MFFFFKQKTAYEMRISDWSSDVCSSDLFVRMRSALAYSKAEKQSANCANCAKDAKASNSQGCFEQAVIARSEATWRSRNSQRTKTMDCFAALHMDVQVPRANGFARAAARNDAGRTEEQKSEIQSLMRR